MITDELVFLLSSSAPLQRLSESEMKKQVPSFIPIDRTESSSEGEGQWTDVPRPPVPKAMPTTDIG